MSGISEAFGFTKFAYLGFPRPGPHAPVYVTTYPAEWTHHYLNRRYQDIDPVVAKTRTSLLPFLWDGDTIDPHPSEEHRLFFGEAKEFGINCGFGNADVAATLFRGWGRSRRRATPTALHAMELPRKRIPNAPL